LETGLELAGESGERKEGRKNSNRDRTKNQQIEGKELHN
jgi:hypothetical protein